MPKKKSKVSSLPVIESNAASIDVGTTEIVVAVPADRDAEPVRCFPTLTVDLEKLADWLQQCHIRTLVRFIMKFLNDRIEMSCSRRRCGHAEAGQFVIGV
jgi:hypothetical protein